MIKVEYNKQFTTRDNNIKLSTTAGKSILEIVEEMEVPLFLYDYLRISINGQYVPSSFWGKIWPKNGTEIRLVLLPQGGDNGELLKMVAAIAIVVASQGAGAAYAGGSLATATGGAFWGGLAITVGLTAVGFLALNAIFPPPEEATASENSAALSLSHKNSSRAGNVVPRVYGTNKFYPPFGAQPYIVSEGGSQVLYLLYDLGYGPLELSELKIGNTPIDEYPDISYTIHESISSSSELVWFSQDVNTEIINLSLADGDPLTSRTTSNPLIFAGLDFQFPAGLASYNAEGTRLYESVTIRITVKDESLVVIDPSLYTAVVNSGPSVISEIVNGATYIDITFTAREENGFSSSVNIETISNYDNLTIEVSRISSTNSGVSQINAMSYSSIRSHLNVSSFSGFRKYDGVNPVSHTMVEIVVRASDQLSGVIDSFNCIASSKLLAQPPFNPELVSVGGFDTDAGWGGVYDPDETWWWVSYLGGTIYAGVTTGDMWTLDDIQLEIGEEYEASFEVVAVGSIGIGVRFHNSTGITAGTNSPTINSLGTLSYTFTATVASGPLYLYNAGGGELYIDNVSIKKKSPPSPEVTSNPAWIFADILTGTLNQRNKDYSKLNWTELQAWADRCDILKNGKPLHTCNFILDYSITLLELLKNVASCGRATLDIFDDYYSVIFEQPQALKKQLFTNMNSWGFRSSRSYVELPHAIKIEFIDPDSNWEKREVVVYSDGYDENNSTLFEVLDAHKITSSDEAYRMGRYFLKVAELRQETITINCDLDWLEVKRGDLCGVQQDVMKTGGSSCRVKEVIGTVVIVDEKANLNQATVSYFELRPQNGDIISGPVAYFNALSPNEVDIGISSATEGDLIVFNEFGKNTYDCIVKQVAANEDMTATVTLIEHAPEILDVDLEGIPLYDPQLGISIDQNSTPLPVLSLQAKESIEFINSLPYISVKLAWNAPSNVIPSYYVVYKQDNETFEWKLQGNTILTEFPWGIGLPGTENNLFGKSLSFAVVAVSENGSALTPEVSSQVTIVLQGDKEKPAAPDYFTVEETAEHFRRFWWGYETTIEPEDLLGFIIKITKAISPDWESATRVHQGFLLKPPFELRAIPSGSYSVLIKSVDTSFNQSQDHLTITFNPGERATENVLFTKQFDPAWEGWGIFNNPIIDINDDLTADSSTAGKMWGYELNLMWNNDEALMWNSKNEAFKFIVNFTSPAAGIFTLKEISEGDISYRYGKGKWPDSFIVDYDESAGTILSSNPYNLELWSQINVSVSQNTHLAPNGLLEADTVTDISATQVGQLSNSSTTIDGSKPHIAGSFIRKTTSAAGFPAMEWETSGVSGRGQLHINTDTAALIYDHINGPIPTYGIIDHDADYWFVWIMPVTDPLNITLVAKLNPAASDAAAFGTYAVAPQTSVVAWGLGVRILDRVKSYTYNVAGENILPYSSPVYVELGDYFVIVDSPSSVQINKVQELAAVVDVPDVNEWFDDIVVAATGDTVLTLTKQFIAITNVGTTIQDDGNGAVVCRIISKTTSSITLRCFNSSNVQVAGLIDARIQGY